MATRHRLAQLHPGIARLAAGPQRVHPPRPRVPRPRHQQEGRHRPGIPSAGRKLPALGHGPLPSLRQYVNVVVAGKHALPQWLNMDAADRSLHGGHWHLAMGQQRPGRPAGRRDGLLRGYAHARGTRCRLDSAGEPAEPEDTRHQCRRPDEVAARVVSIHTGSARPTTTHSLRRTGTSPSVSTDIRGSSIA